MERVEEIEILEEKIRNKTITEAEIIIYINLTEDVEIPEQDDEKDCVKCNF